MKTDSETFGNLSEITRGAEQTAALAAGEESEK